VPFLLFAAYANMVDCVVGNDSSQELSTCECGLITHVLEFELEVAVCVEFLGTVLATCMLLGRNSVSPIILSVWADY
jgi:hypothetical protein